MSVDTVALAAAVLLVVALSAVAWAGRGARDGPRPRREPPAPRADGRSRGRGGEVPDPAAAGPRRPAPRICAPGLPCHEGGARGRGGAGGADGERDARRALRQRARARR